MVKSMTVEEMAKKILYDELFILDVRNEDDYSKWKIEGKKVKSVNVPYFDLIDSVASALEKLPQDNREILVVCAKEGSSEFVAEKLSEAGMEKVYYLQGGMNTWSEFYHYEPVTAGEDLKLYQINRLAKGCLSYMMISEGEALVLDPGRKADVYIEIAQKEGAKIRHIVDTHVHADHISGGPELADKTGAPYYLPTSDVQDGEVSFEPLEKHPRIRMGQVVAEVLAIPTPGHTPGSTSLLVNKEYLLSGDTIFVGGLGRPDLGGQVREWAQMLYETVFTTIADLSDELYVLPGHYSSIMEMNSQRIVGAYLGDIRQSNEMMRTQDRKTFTEAVEASDSSEKPPNFEKIVLINRGLETITPEKATELEIGPNRCAVHHNTPQA